MNSSDLAPTLAVHHLAVVAVDLERAAKFYVGVLGLRELRRWDDAQGRLRSIWCELGGGAFLAIERAETEGPRRDDLAPGFHCVALGIRPDERDTWRERFTRAGVAVFRESAYTLYVRDPEGNIVGLSHFPDAARAG
jgi:catechol 2,3-dioxygenase-like lactoylglutathione lyase family enzyme